MYNKEDWSYDYKQDDDEQDDDEQDDDYSFGVGF